MLVVKKIFRWLASKAILYAALVLAILASAFVVPWLNSEWAKGSLRVERVAQLEQVKDQLEAVREATQARLSKAASAAQGKSIRQLDLAIAASRRAKSEAEQHRRTGLAKTKSLVTADADALLKDGQLELEIQYRDREIAGLAAVRDQMAKGAQLAAFPKDLEARLRQTKAVAAKKFASCNLAQQKLATFEDGWAVRLSFGLLDSDQHDTLRKEARDRCHEATAAYRDERETAETLKRYEEALLAYRQAHGWVDNQVQQVATDLERHIAQERAAVEGSWAWRVSVWAKRVHLPAVLRQAATALAVIIATPYLIRLFCYFVLAPVAMRRRAIRFRASGSPNLMIPLADRSTTSVGVRLAPDEELLVRQDYLQTSSAFGRKGTQWLLDWRHPITSIATGLTFLTRIRGTGEMTTVSAVRDPFAEVTILTLPKDTACVLKPRALAAVAQPIGLRLRVTRHWRLLSLHAWLTMQLRYFVFHGPARLVLKGARGVRMERAEGGRVFEQDQLVGFSTDLAYSVTRTETFWPYFLGREQLLKDHVAAGGGVLIVEEAPMASVPPGEVRHGIEGMIDAIMKVFGW